MSIPAEPSLHSASAPNASLGPIDPAGSGVTEQLEDVLRVTLRLGVLVARSGAAAFRVRNTMQRTAASFGVSGLEVVYSTDALHASVCDRAGLHTQLVKITEIGVDMGRLCRLDMLSRALLREPGRLTVAELDAELDEVERSPRLYPRLLTVPLLGLSCAAFCGVIQGSGWQMAAAFTGASFGHAMRLVLLKRHAHVATLVVTCAFVSAFASWLAARALGWAVPGLPSELTAAGKSVLASVLFLIPGVPLVMSLLDILHFDLVSGLARGAWATLIVACIAIGVLVFLSVTGVSLT